MPTEDTFEEGIKRSLAGSHRLLVGSLVAAAGGFLSALLSMPGMPPRDFSVLNWELPAPIAAVVLLFISMISGYGAWLYIRQARNTIFRIALRESQNRSNLFWAKGIQSTLYSSSALVTSPAVIRILCSFAALLQAGTITYFLMFDHRIGMGLTYLVVFWLYASVFTTPFALLTLNKWLILFRPETYDEGNEFYLEHAFLRLWRMRRGMVGIRQMIRRK